MRNVGLEGQEFGAENFRETVWKQTSDIIAHGERIGTVEVCYLEERPESDEGPFLKEERSLLVAIAERLGRIIERGQTEEAFQQQLEELLVLHAIAIAGAEAANEDALIARATQVVDKRLYADCFGVLLLDETAAVLRAHPSYRPYERGERIAVPLGRGIIGRVAADGRPRRVLDLTSEAEHLEAHPLARSVLCVPLKVRERVIGVINAESRRPDAFSEADERLLAIFASQLATAIEKVRLTATLEQRVADRTRELLALYHVTTVASQSLDLNTALEQSLERVLAAMRSNVGAIQLVDETGELLHLAVQQGIPPDVAAQMDAVPSGDSLAGWVMKHGEPLVVPDIGTDPRVPQAASKGGLLSYVGVPMRVGGRTLGVLSMFGEAGLPFNVEEVALLSSVADQVGVVMENTRLRQLAEEAAVMKERDRLARELHDSVTQSLYSLSLFAEAGRELIKTGDLGRVEHHLARIGETAQQSLKEMRLLVHELRPPVLERDGLVGALHQRLDAVERRAGVEARLLVEELVELPPTVEEGLYRIAQEALNNALKHATAISVTVHLRTDGGRVELEVIDNGRGFDPKAVSDKGGMGLISMRERAEKLGGSLTVLSVPGEGTRVKVSVKRET